MRSRPRRAAPCSSSRQRSEASAIAHFEGKSTRSSIASHHLVPSSIYRQRMRRSQSATSHLTFHTMLSEAIGGGRRAQRCRSRHGGGVRNPARSTARSRAPPRRPPSRGRRPGSSHESVRRRLSAAHAAKGPHRGRHARGEIEPAAPRLPTPLDSREKNNRNERTSTLATSGRRQTRRERCRHATKDEHSQKSARCAARRAEAGATRERPAVVGGARNTWHGSLERAGRFSAASRHASLTGGGAIGRSSRAMAAPPERCRRQDRVGAARDAPTSGLIFPHLRRAGQAEHRSVRPSEVVHFLDGLP